MKLSSFSPTQINIAGSTIAILTLATSFYAVHSAYKSRQSGIESSKIHITQISDQISTTQRDRARLMNSINKLQSSVLEPESSHQPKSINELAAHVVAVTERHGLNLEQFEPASITTINQRQAYPISVRFTAPYPSTTTWIEDLHETMPDIHMVGLSIRSTSPTSPTITADIRLNWYIPDNHTPSP